MKSSSRSNSISTVTSPSLSSTSSSSMLDLANKTASLTRNMAASLGIKIKTKADQSQLNEKHVQFKQCDGSEQVSGPPAHKTNHGNSRKPNGILTNKTDCVKNCLEITNTNYSSEDRTKYTKSQDKRTTNTTEEPGSKDDIKLRLRQILSSLEDRTVCQDLARLAALEMTLSETEVITRLPHLTAGVYKEVGRICQTVLSSMLARLPLNQ